MINNPKKELIVRELIAQRKLADEALKSKTLGNLFAFDKYILGVEKGKDKVPLAPFHQELCNFIVDRRDRKKLVLIPRGHLKSTLVTVGYSLMRIIEDPSIRVLITNATYPLAVDFLHEIKRHLKHNDTIHRLWGQLADGATEWSENRITLKTSKEKFGRREPTVTVAGVETSLASQHYDLIIGDDMVNRENITTREQIEKVILRYKDMLDLLEPNGQLIIIGTRWDDGDLYGWIIDAVKKGRENFDVLVKKAFEGQIDQDAGFEALWPAKFNRQILKQLLLSKQTYEFYCQYMNDVAPIEGAAFRKDYFRYYDMSDIRGKPMNRYLLIDPAFEVKKDSDYTAMVSVGIDEAGNIFVLDIINEKFSPGETIDMIFNLYENYHYNQIGIEEMTFGKTLQYQIYDEFKLRNRYLPITKLKPGDRSKDARIMGLEPLYKSAKIFHNINVRGNALLEYQLTHYPRGSNDDIIDALAYCADLLTPVRPQNQTRWKHKFLYG